MRTILFAAICLLLLPAVRADLPTGGPTRTDLLETGPNSAQLIVGKWEPESQPKAVIVEFTAGGKVKFMAQQQVAAEGTYRFLAPNRVEIAIDAGGKQRIVLTIKKIDSTRFTANSDTDKKTETLKRVK